MHKCVAKFLICAAVPFLLLFLLIPPAQASLKASPKSIDFGDRSLGKEAASKTVTLTNTNSTGNFTIVAISSSAHAFSLTALHLPVTLAPGESLRVGVTFTARAAEAYSGMVGFTTYHGWTVNLPVSGTGIPSHRPSGASGASSSSESNASSPQGHLTFNSLLNFGLVNLGASSAQRLSIANSGNASVTISSVSLAGHLTGSNGTSSGNILSKMALHGLSSGIVLAAGQTISVALSFSPSEAGNSSGTVTIASNAVNSPAVVSWTANTPAAPITTRSVDLRWTGSSTSGVTGYKVYRGTVSGGPYAEITTSPTAGTSFLDSSVTPSATFYYVVTSVANGVESGYSSEIAVAIP